MEPLPWSVDVEKVAAAAAQLLEVGLPASFLLAFAEPWCMAHQVEDLLLLATGNRQICDW